MLLTRVLKLELIWRLIWRRHRALRDLTESGDEVFQQSLPVTGIVIRSLRRAEKV